MTTKTPWDREARSERAKVANAARKDSGEFYGGKYQEPKLPEFYCRECDLEMVTAEGLAHLAPEGWLCLAPWIQTPEGHWWRPHIAGCERYGDAAKKWAEHMASELNKAMTR